MIFKLDKLIKSSYVLLLINDVEYEERATGKNIHVLCNKKKQLHV